MGNAKQMLRNIRSERNLVGALKQKRETIEAEAMKITRDPSDAPSRRGTPPDIGAKVVELVELDKTLEAWIREVAQKENYAIRLINQIGDARYKEILILYYIAGTKPKTWNEVAEEMNYSYETVTHLHGRALQEFQRQMDEMGNYTSNYK